MDLKRTFSMSLLMGAILLAGGAAGKRSALPHSRIMIHQPIGGFRGQASDVAIHAQEMARVKAEVSQILSRHTGKDLKTIEKDSDRDCFMTAQEAKEYGIVDEVFERHASAQGKQEGKKD